MDIHTKLIELYCSVCDHYDNTLVVYAQRQSNNFYPKFTDAECIATFIWGVYNKKFEVKACYEFIRDYYGDWFPDLPSYQAYNKRVCHLAEAFQELAGVLLCSLDFDTSHGDYTMDSIPIVVAGSKRSSRAKTANDQCNKGYCASKEMYYYGIKLFILAQCNHKAKPTPSAIVTTKASEHDLNIAKEMLENAANIRVFCDMAFIDDNWQSQMLTENNVEILTPIKRKKGQKQLPFWDRLYSSAISSVKQAIESLNNLLIEKTNIQRASKVRSSAGLSSFIFARVACALMCF
jgi:hypothetical protein